MSRDREKPEDREDFASRWSRLKRRAKTAPADPVEPAEPAKPGAAPVPPAAGDERPDEEILKELGLPEPETLKPGDDYSGFMAAAVPARIRNRALRRLWLSRPVLANLDGLVDYAEDFTDAATVPEVFRTAYRVGRGWLEGDDEAKPAAPPDRPEAGESDAAGEEAPASVDPPTAEAGGEPVGDANSGAQAGPAPAAPPSVAEGRPGEEGTGEKRLTEHHGAPPRARMRFRFTDK